MRASLSLACIFAAAAGGSGSDGALRFDGEPGLGASPSLPDQNSTSWLLSLPLTTAGENVSAAFSRILGPCCDDADCGPSGAEFADCDARFTCSHVPCPAEPTDPLDRLAAGFSLAGDPCKHRAAPGEVCTCVCRCVCVYPSGSVKWLDAAPAALPPPPPPAAGAEAAGPSPASDAERMPEAVAGETTDAAEAA